MAQGRDGVPALVLGSSSKYRRAILSRALAECPASHPFHGASFSVAVPDIDEKAVRHSDPRVMALMIARAKMDALSEKVCVSMCHVLPCVWHVVVCSTLLH
eukprot:TRINITY_DN17062_c0_g1_i1.p2 TRINITY_DN17062_c0_g1~~TRINITY_DN17062_c0_g1_i1.p2  ORF type:complete len:101 (-),score=20.60 TRINITY_DN17062_c0_g1_i1:209-511(-)